MPYSNDDVQTVTAVAEGGKEIQMIVPISLPSLERCEYLRTLYAKKAEHPGANWKCGARATVPPALVEDMTEAMAFVGSIVDRQETAPNGNITLISNGYYAHGF